MDLAKTEMRFKWVHVVILLLFLKFSWEERVEGTRNSRDNLNKTVATFQISTNNNDNNSNKSREFQFGHIKITNNCSGRQIVCPNSQRHIKREIYVAGNRLNTNRQDILLGSPQVLNISDAVTNEKHARRSSIGKMLVAGSTKLQSDVIPVPSDLTSEGTIVYHQVVNVPGTGLVIVANQVLPDGRQIPLYVYPHNFPPSSAVSHQRMVLGEIPQSQRPVSMQDFTAPYQYPPPSSAQPVYLEEYPRQTYPQQPSQAVRVEEYPRRTSQQAVQPVYGEEYPRRTPQQPVQPVHVEEYPRRIPQQPVQPVHDEEYPRRTPQQPVQPVHIEEYPRRTPQQPAQPVYVEEYPRQTYPQQLAPVKEVDYDTRSQILTQVRPGYYNGAPPNTLHRSGSERKLRPPQYSQQPPQTLYPHQETPYTPRTSLPSSHTPEQSEGIRHEQNGNEKDIPQQVRYLQITNHRDAGNLQTSILPPGEYQANVRQRPSTEHHSNGPTLRGNHFSPRTSEGTIETTGLGRRLEEQHPFQRLPPKYKHYGGRHQGENMPQTRSMDQEQSYQVKVFPGKAEVVRPLRVHGNSGRNGFDYNNGRNGYSGYDDRRKDGVIYDRGGYENRRGDHGRAGYTGDRGAGRGHNADNGYYAGRSNNYGKVHDARNGFDNKHYGSQGRQGEHDYNRNNYRRGHSYNGFRNVYHKDEYQITREYYDDLDDDDFGLTYGGFLKFFGDFLGNRYNRALSQDGTRKTEGTAEGSRGEVGFYNRHGGGRSAQNGDKGQTYEAYSQMATASRVEPRIGPYNMPMYGPAYPTRPSLVDAVNGYVFDGQ